LQTFIFYKISLNKFILYLTIKTAFINIVIFVHLFKFLNCKNDETLFICLFSVDVIQLFSIDIVFFNSFILNKLLRRTTQWRSFISLKTINKYKTMLLKITRFF